MYLLTFLSWIQTVDISEAGCKEAVERVYQGKARFRVVLVNHERVFGKRF